MRSAPRAKEWTKDVVSTWAKSIEGLPEDFSIMLYENGITGRELLALDFDGLNDGKRKSRNFVSHCGRDQNA